MTNTRWSLIATALICTAAALTLYLRAPDSGYIVKPSPLIKNRPAGEFTKGFVLEQLLNMEPAQEGAILRLEKVCIKPLLATYDRPNRGVMRISLIASQWSSVGIFDFKDSPNNDYATICQDIRHEATGVQKTTLRIEGIEGESGSSSTAWLTQDTSLGSAVINGKPTNMSLVFALTNPTGQWISRQNILVFIYLLATAVLTFSAIRTRAP